MLTTQQIIREVETPEQIKTCSRNADGCDGMVVHGRIVEVTL